MRANRTTASWTLAGLAGLAFLVGCVGSGDEAPSETEQAFALRSELSGSPEAGKTFVCHIPPGEPANAHTIHIANAAVDAHLAHGDSLGQCDQVLVQDTGTECQKRIAHLQRKTIQNVVVQDSGSWKVTLCHLPPGNTANGHDITVGPSAVEAHLAHGDVLGACSYGYDTVIPDSGKKCTETDDTDTDTDTDTTGTTGPGTDTGSDTTVTVPPLDNT